MQYFDKNGKEIKAGMKILMDDGSIEMVYDTDDQYGNPSLGINASNEEFLKLHPNWAREYYSLSNFNPSSIEICPSEQEIRDELEQLTPIIEGTELRLDYCGHWHTDKRIDKMHFLFTTFESLGD